MSLPTGDAFMELKAVAFFTAPGFTPNDIWGWYMTDENNFVALADYWPNAPIRFNPVVGSKFFTFQFFEGTI